MKTNRFFSVFLLMVLLTSLLITPPALADETAAQAAPELNAKAALLVDANTGAVVYARNEHQELYPASTTKIMTALLVLEAVDEGKLSMSEELTASRAAMTTDLSEDGSTANIKEGEIMTVEEYLTCMLVVSANEACNVLAEAVSGSVEAFVDAMNAKAEELGCENTHFVNTSGLHDSQHYTSAWDLYLITAEALKYDDFMRICDTATATIPATNLSEARTLHTSNYLIGAWWSRGYLYDDAHGIKTGSTSQAGHCLVSSATRGSLSFISVVLGADQGDPGRRRDPHKQLLRHPLPCLIGLRQLLLPDRADLDELIRDVGVALSKTDRVSCPSGRGMWNCCCPTAPIRRPGAERWIHRTRWTPPCPGTGPGTYDPLPGTTRIWPPWICWPWRMWKADALLVLAERAGLFQQDQPWGVVLIVLGVLILALVLWKLTLGRRRYRTAAAWARQSRGGGYRAAAIMPSHAHEKSSGNRSSRCILRSEIGNQLLQGLAAGVEPGGMGAIRRITQRQQRDRHQTLDCSGKAAQKLLRIEHAHIGGCPSPGPAASSIIWLWQQWRQRSLRGSSRPPPPSSRPPPGR
jgi:D-alanyl-D-alanine carboxypeptidase (penicillin-binding protein 5/6)